MALHIAVNRTVSAPVLLCFFKDPINREIATKLNKPFYMITC